MFFIMCIIFVTFCNRVKSFFSFRKVFYRRTVDRAER